MIEAQSPPTPSAEGSEGGSVGDLSDEDSDYAEYQRWKEAHKANSRRRGRSKNSVPMPPILDLRFEQSYLVSLKPFITKVSASEQPTENRLARGSTDLFSGPIKVDWYQVVWLTCRDQVSHAQLMLLCWVSSFVTDLFPFSSRHAMGRCGCLHVRSQQMVAEQTTCKTVLAGVVAHEHVRPLKVDAI